MNDDERARIRATTIEECATVCDEFADNNIDSIKETGYLLADHIRSLASSPATAISESDVLRHRAEAAEARFTYAIKILTRIHSFLLPNDVHLPDGRIFEFNNPKVEHEMLRGLRDAIRAVPDEIASIDAARDGGGS